MVESLNIYLISQDINSEYDTYSDAVVVAYSEDAARQTHPSGRGWPSRRSSHNEWCEPKDVKVELIGVAAAGVDEGVICSSYHAG